MRPTFWTSLFLKVIGAARNSVSRAGQSNPSPMNELVPTSSNGAASVVWLASCSEGIGSAINLAIRQAAVPPHQHVLMRLVADHLGTLYVSADRGGHRNRLPE